MYLCTASATGNLRGARMIEAVFFLISAAVA